MKLINCPACQKQISKKAETCPHCGHPIEKERKNFESIIAMAVLAVMMFITFIVIKYFN